MSLNLITPYKHLTTQLRGANPQQTKQNFGVSDMSQEENAGRVSIPLQRELESAEKKYTVETLIVLMTTIKNIAIVWGCAWTIVSLYGMSHSWHSLWPLLMLCFVSTVQFKRD